MTAKKKQPPKPGTTTVKDRVVGMPLGREAQMLAEFLRGCGADPKLVPDLHDNLAQSSWTAARGRYSKLVPMWVLDLAVAVLEQIPQRSLRKSGRPTTDAVRDVEFWARIMPVAEAARTKATLEARQRDEGVCVSEDEIAKRAEDLARQVYRRRQSDVP